MGDPDPNEQRPPMWAPYGFVPFGMQPQNSQGQLQEQMPMQMAMMNPMMSPMMNPMMAGMMRGSGYGQMQFPPQMMMPPIPNQLQLAHHDDDDIEADDIAANYPTGNWNQEGMQPMVYPMMMMMPYNHPTTSQYPDVVEDGAQEEFIDAVSDFPEDNLRRFDHDVTPDLVRAAIENEPTYMNEQQVAELPSYANENILLAEEEPEAPNPPPLSQQYRKPQSRPIRAQSVQPTSKAGPVYQNDNDEKGQNYQGKKYNTYRSPRSGRSESVLRSYPLSKSMSTASHIHAVSELNRPPTVLHIPDIKPRIRRGSGGSLASTTSLLPSSVNTNLREMGSKLGKSLLNLKNILSGSNYNLAESHSTPQFKPRPKDTPIVPRRPARRKSSFCKSKINTMEGSKDHQFSMDDTIREVDTPVESPTFPREPKVPMPGESVPTSPSARKPSVPMPGVPRIPSPTSTINTLELIGSPTTSRPRVRQPSGTMSPILKNKNTPKYENTETPDPAVPMPGTPSQSVKLRQNPGRTAPSVPQPQGSNKMRRSNRFSGGNSTTPFHSTTSTGFFSLEDADVENKIPLSPNLSHSTGGNSTFQNSLSSAPQAVFSHEGRESSLSNSSQLLDMPSSVERSSTFGDIAALEESNRIVMERLKRNELPTPSIDYDEISKSDSKKMNLLQTVERPEPSITPLSNVTDENMMTETRDDLLQGIRDMDDSIQTLKAEMSKLMSVYEYVKFKPEETAVIEAAPDITIDQCDTESINIIHIDDLNLGDNRSEVAEKPVTPMITEIGQTVLEIVGDEAMIKFKDYGGIPVEEAITTANITIGPQRFKVDASVHESDYNVELGVYHENEMSGQPTLSPKPFKKIF